MPKNTKGSATTIIQKYSIYETDTFTVNDNLYVGGVNIIDELNTKQDAIGVLTDVVCSSITCPTGNITTLTTTTNNSTTSNINEANIVGLNVTDVQDNTACATLLGDTNIYNVSQPIKIFPYVGQTDVLQVFNEASSYTIQLKQNGNITSQGTITGNTLSSSLLNVSSKATIDNLLVDGTIESSGIPNQQGITAGLNVEDAMLKLTTSGDVEASSMIDFCQLMTGNSYEGRIEYDNENSRFILYPVHNIPTTYFSQTETRFETNETYFGSNANCQFRITTDGDTSTPNNTVRLKVGYKGATKTAGYCTFDMGNSQTFYIWDHLETSGNILSGGNITCGGSFSTSTANIGDLNLSGDLTIDTNTFFVDTTNNAIGIGTITPSHALSVCGTLDNTVNPLAGVHMCLQNGNTAKIELVSLNGTQNAFIDFTKIGDDYQGRIGYNLSTNEMNFRVNGTIGGIQMILSDGELDLTDCNLITTGDISGVNLTVTDTITTAYLDASDTITCQNIISTYKLEGAYTKAINNVPYPLIVTGQGVYTGMNGDDAIIKMSGAFGSANQTIDFCRDGIRDYDGRIRYTTSGQSMKFYCNNSGTETLTLTNGVVTLGTSLFGSEADISTTADVQCSSIVCSNVRCDTDLIYTDSTNNRVGINTSTPTSMFEIKTSSGTLSAMTYAGVSIGADASNNTTLQLASSQTGAKSCIISFTNSDAGDVEGRIVYGPNANTMTFRTGSIDQMIISTSSIDCKDNNIVTTGTISGNLNSTKGQLITFFGEDAIALAESAIIWNYGNNVQSTDSFGIMVPCGVKLKKFTYSSASGVGTNYSTSTKIVFRLYVDGVAQDVYAYCDYSNTTNGDVTTKRFTNKFSSSATSQIDTEPTYNSTYGQSLSWAVWSLAGYNTDNNRHRFSIICETIEDL